MKNASADNTPQLSKISPSGDISTLIRLFVVSVVINMPQRNPTHNFPIPPRKPRDLVWDPGDSEGILLYIFDGSGVKPKAPSSCWFSQSLPSAVFTTSFWRGNDAGPPISLPPRGHVNETIETGAPLGKSVMMNLWIYHQPQKWDCVGCPWNKLTWVNSPLEKKTGLKGYLLSARIQQ